MQLFHTQFFQITPLTAQDLVTPSVDLVTDTTSMLASVPAAKLAQLEARVARVPLPSADSDEDISDSDEDISGSDSDPADPEYLPKDCDKESSLASDSSGDEVILTLLMQLFNSFLSLAGLSNFWRICCPGALCLQALQGVLGERGGCVPWYPGRCPQPGTTICWPYLLF